MSTPTSGAPASAPAAAPAPESVTPNTASEVASEESSEEESEEGSPESAAVAAASQKEAKKAAENRKKKFQLKIDGREEEVELDLDNEDEVKKHLQLSKAAQKRMQQFAEYEKGVKGLLETLRTDPLKVLADPRLNIPEETRKKMAEAIINNEIEEMNKTPEQREKERIQKEYEELKKQYENEKKTKEQEEFQRLQEQAAVQLDTEISSAIEQAGLPKNARTVRYMAEALMFAVEHNLDLTAKDLVPYVKKHALNGFRELISALPDEDFESFLGKDQISRIRKRGLQKIKQAAVPSSPDQIKPTGESVKKRSEEAVQKIEFKDFFKKLGK